MTHAVANEDRTRVNFTTRRYEVRLRNGPSVLRLDRNPSQDQLSCVCRIPPALLPKQQQMCQEVAALRAPHMFRHIFERDGDTPRRLGRNARPNILLRARLDGGTAMWPRPDKSKLSNLGR